MRSPALLRPPGHYWVVLSAARNRSERARESWKSGHSEGILVDCDPRSGHDSGAPHTKDRSRERYPSDLTDEQWALLEPLLPAPVKAGAPRRTDLREVLDAIFYVLSTGRAWWALPHDFAPEGTVRDYFHQWRRKGIWERVHDALRRRVRESVGREPEPSAGNIDSQTVKATRTAGARGYDAGEKNNGIKRHILVDTIGLVLVVVVHAANIQDRDGAKLVFAEAMRKGPWPRMGRAWADGGYAGKLIAWVGSLCGWVLEIVKRDDDIKGFKLLPRRWVVERTFSWLSNHRRLSKHYEYRDETGEAKIYLAMIHLMLRRLTKKRAVVAIA